MWRGRRASSWSRSRVQPREDNIASIFRHHENKNRIYYRELQRKRACSLETSRSIMGVALMLITVKRNKRKQWQQSFLNFTSWALFFEKPPPQGRQVWMTWRPHYSVLFCPVQTIYTTTSINVNRCITAHHKQKINMSTLCHVSFATDLADKCQWLLWPNECPLPFPRRTDARY